MLMSKKFILLLHSVSVVNCNVGDISLKASYFLDIGFVFFVYHEYVVNISEVPYYFVA